MPTADPSTDSESLRSLLDTLGAFVFTKDSEGRYTYVNATLLKLFERSESEVLGRTAAELLGFDDTAETHGHDLLVLAQGKTLEGEERVRWLDGSERTYWTVKRPQRDAQGQIIGLCGVSTDITERKQLDARLQEQRQLLDVVLNTIDAYVYMKDENRRYRYVNTKTASNLGIRAEDAVGKLDSEVLPKAWADQFWALDRQVFTNGKPVSAEEIHVAADGSVLHHWSTKVPIRYEGVPALIGFSTDITELLRLREQAITDSLTGLFNRRHFTDLAHKELARARRHRHPTSLLMVDIDHFKQVNDRFGHPVGDTVLRRLAELLRAVVRAEDTAARVGGEEFALLLPRTDLEAGQLLAERIRNAARDNDKLLPDGERLTLSLGLVVSSEGSDQLDRLYAAADAQLYRAKQAGRDRVCANCLDQP
jgi:diguanylate cyclase (GGDEF)-like protein/PAS domain S-box-containing protein